MAKERINLLLDRDAIERARRYSERHETSISALVSGFLARLPEVESAAESELTPTVRRLLGAASGGPDREEYRRHLLEKHRR